MKILLLAPHPFYQERGTPIAIDLLLRALSERGDTIDVLTFHEGEDRSYPGVTIYRAKPWLPIAGVKPGFSLKKVWCDICLFCACVRLVRRKRYDLIHAVEESAFVALIISLFTGTRFLYDMDSSLSSQLCDRFPFLKRVSGMLRFLESLPIRRAVAVVPMCDALADEARRLGAKKVIPLRDVSLLDTSDAPPETETLRATLPLQATVLMYIGNLESYQGIDLLLHSFAHAVGRSSDLSLVVIGGAQSDIEHYRAECRRLGIAENVHFLGPRPVSAISSYMAQADILVSPRTQGQNTPMKVYTYLASGVAVLATDLPTHTQVMSRENCMLTRPEPEAYAEGMLQLADNPELRRRLGARAQALIEKQYSFAAFKRALYELYEQLDTRPA